MKFLLPLLLIFISLSAFTPAGGEEMIAWEAGVPLTWNQFRGAVEKDNPHHAQSHCMLDASVKNIDNSIFIEVNAYFLPAQSWTRVRDDEALLHHEQLHFDITELHARMLRKRLIVAFRQNRDLALIFEQNFDDVNAALQKMQERYDRETQHGTRGRVQRLWEEKITASLREYRDFAEPAIRFILQ